MSAFALIIATSAASTSPAAAAPAQDAGYANYIVQLRDWPVVAYDGSTPGLAATRPAPGTKVDPADPDVMRYVDHLIAQHAAALARAGGTRFYDYEFSFNGFAARLTDAQAARLQRDPSVVTVERDELVSMDTSSTPKFLGLDDPNDGLWKQLGGVDSAGENVIIGVIDSGIWAESLSFSDRTGTNGNASKDGKLAYTRIRGWHGRCVPGEGFTADQCNQKLIGAQFFNAGWGGSRALEATRPWEFMSPRDYNGHGTHTSSTAGGDHAVPTTGAAAVFGPISGMAPRARIAMYKALWSTRDASQASGYRSDLVAAIDAAVADGVDVINYSISGTTTNFLDSVQVSYLFAAAAGIFVSASAGNDGPTTSTVAHPGPWLTTVAAGTHNRAATGSVTLGNSVTYTGPSLATAVGPAPLIDSSVAGVPGATQTKVDLCYAATDNGGTAVLDPAKVTGKIVVCDRGTTPRVNKSLAVKEAGGVGMILLNTSPGSLNADLHFVPTVHLADTYRTAVNAYAATPGATATINAATITYNEPAPFTASFSSRGPLKAGNGDLLKPDLMAPGQDILASVAPPGNAGRDFNVYSGTSMSAPHVAGLAALLKQLHPTWSPMAIKSALMTSAYDVLDAASSSTIIFRQGAGFVRPNRAADPGLVYDSGLNDWLAFLCGTTTGVNASTCTSLKNSGYSLDPSDLNVASIAIGDMVGTQTVKRTVKNVGTATTTYAASVTGLSGITATVTPSSVTLPPGATATFTVAFERTTAALGNYTGGFLTWSDGSHIVRSPIVIRPIAIVAPTRIDGLTGSDGATAWGIKTGYNGTLSYERRGLIPATTLPGTVADDPTDHFNTDDPASNQGIKTFDVAVPSGTTYARFSLFDDYTDGNDDLDLYVYQVSGTNLILKGSSAGPTANEEVNIVGPAAATYRVFVHGFQTEGPDAQFTLFTWVLGTTNAGNMTVSGPTTVTTGGTGTVSLTWSGLSAGTKYLGSVAYSDGTTTLATTIVRIDVP